MGAGQRSQHEKRRLVGFDFIHQKANVRGDLLGGVPRQPDNVAGVHQYAGVMPFFDNAAIFLDLVLLLSFGLKVLRIDAFHANENLRATGARRQRHEVLWLLGQIHLHHERYVETLFAQLDNFLEGFAPKLFTGKVIVREKIEG